MDAYISTAGTIVKFVLATIVYVYAVSFVVMLIVKFPEFVRFLRGNNSMDTAQGAETEEARRGE